MEDIRTSWGETVPITIQAEDATSATLYIGEISNPLVTVTNVFTDGAADISAPAEDMEIPVGNYSYQVKLVFDSGDIRYFPDSSCEECSLPTITVCPTIDMPEES